MYKSFYPRKRSQGKLRTLLDALDLAKSRNAYRVRISDLQEALDTTELGIKRLIGSLVNVSIEDDMVHIGSHPERKSRASGRGHAAVHDARCKPKFP